MMEIRFWGVRGSIATPGPATARVGGNTSCVEVRTKDAHLVLDAGTGLRNLGDALLARNAAVDATVLLSHYHWDHIQGLPFFTPAYMPGTRLEIVGGPNGVATVEETLREQMRAPVFPVRWAELAADVTTREVRPGQTFCVKDARITVAKLNHPGGVYGYRIEAGGAVIVYATDTEHYACVDPALKKLAEGADVLICDAQYTPEEYRGDGGRSRVGWGHSTYAAAADVARAAGVKQLVLFHHDPARTDDGVDDVEARTRALFSSTVAAREGMVIATDALSHAA